MQFASDEVDDFETATELIDETFEHEQERLECFDRVFKFDGFFENG